MSKEYYKKRIAALENMVEEMKKKNTEYISFDIDREEECDESLILDDMEYGLDEDEEYSDEEMQEHLNMLNRPVVEHLSKFKLNFPEDIFPGEIIEHAQDAAICLNFPLPYYLSSILVAISTAIGTKIRAEILPGREATSLLMLTLVGHPSINKTSPLKAGLAPLFEYEEEHIDSYNKALKEYHMLSTEEKKKTPPPNLERCITADFTMEALLQLAIKNKKGIVAYSDEFAGLLKGMNMYRKGNDEEMFLQIFSDVSIRKDRMDRQEIAKNVFINLVGTIQTEVITDFINGSKANNGFFDRLLYVCLDDIPDSKWNNKKLNPALKQRYHDLVKFIAKITPQYDDNGDIIPRKAVFTESALNKLIAWQHKNSDYCKRINNRLLIGITKKLEIYVCRFALIIAVTDYAYKSRGLFKNHDTKIAITETHVSAAIKLALYFFKSARQLVSVVPDKNNLKKANARLVEFHDKLPACFDTRKAYKVGSTIGISARTVANYLNSDYFKKVAHAHYEKLMYKDI